MNVKNSEFSSTPPEVLIFSIAPEAQFQEKLAKDGMEELDVKMFIKEDLVIANPASTSTQ